MLEILGNILLTLVGPAATVGPLFVAVWRTTGDDRRSR